MARTKTDVAKTSLVQNTSAKKSNFLSELVASAQALKAARDTCLQLAEKIGNDVALSGITDDDCVGTNSHLTRTLVDNYTTVVIPGFTANIHLANLLAMLPD